MLKSQRIWLSLASRVQQQSLLALHAAFKATARKGHAVAQRSTYDIAARTQKQTVEFITSTSNAVVKHCVKLRTNARYRAEHRQFVLTGLDLLQEAAGGDGRSIHAQVLFVPKHSDVTNETASLPWLTADRLIVADENVLKKLTGLSSVDSVTAVAQLELPQPVNLADWQVQGAPSTHGQQSSINGVQQGIEPIPMRQPPQQPNHNTTKHQLVRLLALDGVQDPGNIGTLIRSALAFGWDAIYLLPGCCDPYNEKAVRASRGAVLRMPIAAGNLDELVKLCSDGDMVLIAAEPNPDEQAAHDARNQAPTQELGVCLVLGSEGRGLSPTVLQVCTPVAIPMAGAMESLNVGVAGSILMFMLSPAGGMTLTARLAALGLNGLWNTDTNQTSS